MLTPTPLPSLRAAIARAWLDASAAAPVERRLGDVVLWPHQAEAVARLCAAMDEFGGALLADAVGLGKTYVALAAAAAVAPRGRALVVAPAALGPMWAEAGRRAAVPCEVATFERLSRGARVDGGRELLIVDEAHHARNPATVRYRALAELAAGARVLLLSATPVHNRRRDLDALLALFLGARAEALTPEELARCVVRRTHRDAGAAAAAGLPEVAPLAWLAPAGDDALLRSLLALPPPVPPADGGDAGGALLALGLVRQWASSDGALRAALRRRLARAGALVSALERGLHPSAAELRAWAAGDDGETLQLALAELLCATPAAPGTLLASARAHEGAVRSLLDELRTRPDRDADRARLLRELRTHHPGEKLVAFSCYADTVRALYRQLARDPRVAALTAEGATIAGGTLSRAGALARFAPAAAGAREPAECERVDLLLTTDLLSEGVNLQDASVVVHLDVPWTPARLEQRVGRVARMGSPHARVHVYALRPPASAAALLETERRLADKLRSAGHAVGVSGSILPGLATWLGTQPAAGAAPEAGEAIRRHMERWLPAGGAPWAGRGPGSVATPIVAAARAEATGFLALCQGPRLVAAVGGGPPTDDPAVVARAVAMADGAGEAEVDAGALDAALLALARWRARRTAASAAGARGAATTRGRRLVLQRIARITRGAPRHLRPSVAALALDARHAAAGTHGAAAEERLAELARAEMPDLAWLRSVSALRPARRTADGGAAPGEGQSAVVALLLLIRPADGR